MIFLVGGGGGGGGCGLFFFFFQAEDGIRYLVRSRGLGDVYKRQARARKTRASSPSSTRCGTGRPVSATSSLTMTKAMEVSRVAPCLLYTSDAADERSSVDLGGRRIIKKKTTIQNPEQLRRGSERTKYIPEYTRDKI